MFSPYFIGVITSSNVFKNEGFEKKSKKWGGHIEGLSIGVQTVRTLCIETSSLMDLFLYDRNTILPQPQHPEGLGLNFFQTTIKCLRIHSVGLIETF